MRGVQNSELPLNPQQEKDQGKASAQKILPQMPQTHIAQRVEIEG